MKSLKYKGYIGSVHYSPEDQVFCGKVENIDGLITFEAEHAKDFEKNFQQAVDDYLADCVRLNIPPQKPKIKRKHVVKSSKTKGVMLQS
jgi:predicted HicB family RNase H-like nuclease